MGQRNITLLSRKYAFERTLVFLFLFFLIFEGALRKWFLPFLATPLVVVRDPIALLLVIQGVRHGFFKNNNYVWACFGLSFVSYALSFFLDETNLMVTYFGTRIFLLYVPAIFVMAKVLTPRDLYRLGKICLYISIPLTILVALQYFSPQSSIVNRGIGGDETGSGFGGTGGFYRPSGIFSFTQGYVAFQGFVITYIMLFLVDAKSRIKANISMLMVLVCLVFFIVSLPLSLSRTNVIQTVLIAFTAVIGSIISGTNRVTTIKYLACTIALAAVILMLPYMQMVVDVLLLRFSQAEDAEGDLVQGSIMGRYVSSIFRPWLSDETTLLGHGIGQGTRLAMKMLNVKFFTDEEWERILYESGYILGAGYLLIRCFLCFEISILTIRQCYSNHNFTALLFLPSTIVLLVQGPWGNAVPLGFAVASTAFSMVWLKRLKRIGIAEKVQENEVFHSTQQLKPSNEV